MRPTAILVLLSLAFAGCITKGGGAPDANATAPTSPMLPADVPAPITDSKEVTGGLDPANTAPGGVPCATPQNQCQRYPFQLNVSASMTADLTWTLPASDFDLHVFKDGAPVDDNSGSSSPPGTAEHLAMDLEPGSYELVVTPWGVPRDTYTVNATFVAK